MGAARPRNQERSSEDQMSTNQQEKATSSALANLAHFVMRHRWLVVGIRGSCSRSSAPSRRSRCRSAGSSSSRSRASRPTRRTSGRCKTFGIGRAGAEHRGAARQGRRDEERRGPRARSPGSRSEFPRFRTSSYYTTGSLAYVSPDRHTTFATFYPPGQPSFSSDAHFDDIRPRSSRRAPPGVETHVTGRDALYDSQGSASGGPSVLTEAHDRRRSGRS